LEELLIEYMLKCRTYLSNWPYLRTTNASVSLIKLIRVVGRGQGGAGSAVSLSDGHPFLSARMVKMRC